ncbi:MAG: hypothetical protein K0R05_799 [Anaerocolumna sp.]|nr:hypothetical protein [Anaerocolumna sp.]
MLKSNQVKKQNIFNRSISYVLMGTMMVFLLTGCMKTNSGQSETGGSDDTDGTSSASIVNTAEEFEKAISADGNWIICPTKDLTIDKDLVIDGEFTNGKKDDSGKDVVQRKVALYSQDADRNITARYTLTVPKLTIKSPYASLQHGKFVGDVIVDALNFQLVDNEVQGNIYFTSQEAKDSFTMDATSTVSGVQELQK